jgi:GNAT superfamily N-acetyltransferase
MLAHAEPGAGAADGVVGTLNRPDGPALTVRTVTDADVEGLDALFQGLSTKDRRHRFFGLCHPAREFLQQLTRAEDEGGYRLVAAVAGPGGALVAEAGYAILPDGDGEFALTVAPGWQGWRLGHRLLGAVVAAAAARGVPNLQADIMAGNTRMLALLRRRGYITLAREELSEIRIAIGAAQPARRRQPGNAEPLGPLVSGTLASCAPAA